MEQFGEAVPPDAGGFDDTDAELARAIEASYAAQTSAGMDANEDEMLAEALRLSALEEEARKRRELGLSPEEEDLLVGSGAKPDTAMDTGTSARASLDTDSAAERWPTGVELGGTSDSIEADLAAIAAASALDHPSDDVRMQENLAAIAAASALDHPSNDVRMQDDIAALAAAAAFDTAMVPPERQTPVPPEHLIGGAADGEMLAPPVMDADAMQAAAVAEQAEDADRQLAMAIEASYEAQTANGQAANEEDLMAQALKMSQQEEEARQRNELRQQQEMELKESILMDQMREEEQKRRRTEDEQLKRMEQERVEEEARRKETEEKQKKDEEEMKRARIPPEPPADEPGRVDFMIRLPDGKRMRRAFSGTCTVGQVYDFVDVEASEALMSMAAYRLVTTMPRQTYEDRSLTLADAGLKGQCALNIEAVQQT